MLQGWGLDILLIYLAEDTFWTERERSDLSAKEASHKNVLKRLLPTKREEGKTLLGLLRQCLLLCAINVRIISGIGMGEGG